MDDIKVVGIWNPKGGQGKSMLAINLAAAAIDLGIKPIVICQDQQGTSMNYYKEGNLNFTVISKIPKEKPDAELIIIDYQASDWEIPEIPEYLVMPLKPARDQYATYKEAYNRAIEADKKY